jgi:leucyl aminopeptidase
MLPVTVRFGAAPGAASARAGVALRDGFDAGGQTIRLDTAGGFEAAGARAWAALAPGHTSLEIDAGAPDDAVALACGAALRAWGPRQAPPCSLYLRTDRPARARALWAEAAPGIAGNLFARDLVVLPANVLTPAGFVERLRALTTHGLKVEVRGRAWLERQGYGALSAVGRAARTGPYLVTLRWPGEGPPVALVGKGMCFDTGGISIKPARGMQDMRADMAGAAACAGAMLALALGRARRSAVAVLAIAENTTGADSYRPGDVLRCRSGLTVEVVDTDAEGRLALADALHHAVAVHRPRAVLDAATLTGSIVTALGHHHAGIFGNDSGLCQAALAAGRAVGEPLWPMPIGVRHREDLGSAIADIRQCMPAGHGRQPDASHAAAFLREFVGATPWAHLDIAGMDLAEAGNPFAAKGMPTGFGARLFARLTQAL